MKPRRTRCLFLQSMEGYIHGLMAVYHARLLRSLSCVLGAHTRERDMRERKGRGTNGTRAREKKRERGEGSREDQNEARDQKGREYYTYTYTNSAISFASRHASLQSNNSTTVYNDRLLIVGSLIALRTLLYARS